ncbi:hypothetical protein [Pseudobutyrivibrio sp.]|uniref:hypothetical protein n=1 Tax=Pseudobutyrivibrio sp. TaxID=2014367 RepID=UPI001B57BA39|nr:hypothetical protein [Pseudobutyrivibrio sp.]MBP3261217.1 hypothetical protein [Pseudobutyrivibrio sp.]
MLTYEEVVSKAKSSIAHRDNYKNKHVIYKECPTWVKGDQINLWSYWQGYQIKDIDNGIDILLVGQDWGNPNNNPSVIDDINKIQEGEEVFYDSSVSLTDRNLVELFGCLGCNIASKDSGKRILFTNYSLGYREGSETGGMTKSLMRQDSELFNDLVMAVKPRIIICLGKLTYEMVAGKTTKGFVKWLKNGEPFVTQYPSNENITVYGVAHPGSRGTYNVGGKETMLKIWEKIAEKEGYKK